MIFECIFDILLDNNKKPSQFTIEIGIPIIHIYFEPTIILFFKLFPDDFGNNLDDIIMNTIDKVTYI